MWDTQYSYQAYQYAEPSAELQQLETEYQEDQNWEDSVAGDVKKLGVVNWTQDCRLETRDSQDSPSIVELVMMKSEITKKDSYPLLRIDDPLDSLSGVDLTSRYWQVEKSALSANIGSKIIHSNAIRIV